MKRHVLFSALSFALLCPAVAAGQSSHDGRAFLKRTENNFAPSPIIIRNGRCEGNYNLNSKSAVERRFFGDFNAPAEYFYAPSAEASPDGPIGWRLYRDSTDRWVLEVKRFANFREAETELDREFPYRSILYGEKLSDEEKAEIERRNREMLARRNEERPKRYRVASRIVPLADSSATRLYDRMVRTIDGYVSPGRPARYTDGYSVTFRTVVGHEVRTLRIDNPDGEVEKLADLFLQLIADIEAGRNSLIEMLR